MKRWAVWMSVAGGVAVAAVVAAVLARHRPAAPGPAGWPEWPAPLADCVHDMAQSEAAHDAYAKSVRGTFVKGLKTLDWGLAGSGMSPDFRGAFPARGAGTPVPDPLFELTDFPQSDLPTLDAAAYVAVFRDRCASWASVERASWRTFEFRLRPDGLRARFAAHLQFAGALPSGGRDDFQGIVEGEATREGGDWKLRRVRLREGFQVVSPRPPFVDMAREAGLVLPESADFRRAATQSLQGDEARTAGGLSVFDFNGDGFWDILVTIGNRQASLFINDGHGGFTRGPSPASKPEEAAYFFLCLDLDGDGRPEAAGTQVLGYRDNQAWLGLHTWSGSEWKLVPGALTFPNRAGLRDLVFQGIVPSDVDRDGKVDLFYCGYTGSQSRRREFNRIAAYDACDNALFMNRSALSFSEESDARGIHGTQYTFAAAFFDLDADGNEDLLEVNDYGPNVVWLGDGKGKFREAKGHRLAADPAYSMGVSIADVGNDGTWSVYVSNMYSHAGNRLVPLADGLEPAMREKALTMAIGNQYFSRGPGGAWEEKSFATRTNFADWSWSCSFFDVDNDGDRDLFVTNGFKSSEDRDAPDW